jgi:capsular polysaccharide biosynthesis protein
VEEEISLRELIEILLKGKWVIIGLTLIALIISGIVSFYVLEPTYEAKAVLSVEKYIIPTTANSGLAGLVDVALKSADVTTQTYVSLAKATNTLEKVMDKLQIDAQKLPVSVLSGRISVQNIKNTDLIEITVKDNDALRAASIANTLALELTKSAVKNYEEKGLNNKALLEKQAKAELEILENQQAELKKFLQQSDSVIELEAELNTALVLLSDLQNRETYLRIEINKATIMIETIEEQLADIPIKIELKDQELTREELNPVYIELKKELELNKALVAQLQAEQKSVLEETASISNTINELQITLADKKLKQEHLQLNLEAAKDNYLLLVNKREELEYIEAMNNGNGPLRVVSMASVPQVPVAPKKALNLAVAGCLGLMLGVFVVLFRSYWVNSATNSKA